MRFGHLIFRLGRLTRQRCRNCRSLEVTTWKTGDCVGAEHWWPHWWLCESCLHDLKVAT